MSSSTEISALYREFTDALTEVLAENATGSARRGRLARARALYSVFVHRHARLLDASFRPRLAAVALALC
jgi:hypothetical protein